MVRSYPIYSVLLLVCLAPFIFIRGIFDYATLPQFAFIQIGVVLIFLIFLCFYRRLVIYKTWLNASVILFLSWALISAASAHNGFEGFKAWSHWFVCGLLFFLIQQFSLSTEQIKRLLVGLYVSGVIVSVIGICQHFFGFSFIPQSASPSATMANCNIASQLITLTFPIVVLIRKNKLLSVLCSATMLLFLYLTQCNAAIVSVAFEIAALTILLFHRYLVQFISIHRFTSSMLALLLVVMCLEYSKMIPNGSITTRLSLAHNTIQMIKDKPILGHGLGNYNVFYPIYQKNKQYTGLYNEKSQVVNAHNDPLQIIAETGIVGGCITLSIFIIFFITIIKLLRWSRNDDYLISTVIGSATAGILLNSCFSFPSRVPIPPMIVMVYLAIGLSLSDNNILRLPQKIVPVFISILLVMFVFTTQYQYHNILQSKYIKYARAFEQIKNWKAVLLFADKGFAENKHNKKVLEYSGRAHIQMGQFQQGVDDLREVLDVYPYRMNTLLNIGVAYSGLNQDEKSIEFYERVLEIKPDQARAYLNMAVSCAKLKQNDKAIAFFKKAQKLAEL